MTAAQKKTIANQRAAIASLENSVRFYIDRMGQAQREAREQRRRRLAQEEEIPFIDRQSGRGAVQTEPVVKYIERKVYKPMPPKLIPFPVYIDCFVEPVVVPKPLKFFGRLGDRIDRLLKK